MTAPLTFELNSFEMTVKSPDITSSWIEGLKPLIDDLASDQPVSMFEPYEEISKQTHKDIGEAIYKAMIEYRSGAQGEHSFKDYLSWMLYDEFGDKHQDSVWNAYGRQPVDGLYSDLDDVMSDYDGPVADIDEVLEAIHSAVVEKIEENDTSTVLDLFDRFSIRLTFNPHYNPEAGGVDDLMLYRSMLETNFDSTEVLSFLRFLRLDRKTVMPLIGLDYKDTDGIRSKLDILKKLNHQLPPVLSAKELSDLFDNVGSSVMYPYWAGEVSFEEIVNCDPKMPIRLKGGVIALMDIINGSGDYTDLPDESVLVIEPDQLPSPEYWSYGLYEVFGGSRSYQASIETFDPKINPEAHADKSKDVDYEASLG